MNVNFKRRIKIVNENSLGILEGLLMNNTQRTMAILNYQDYDRLPIVHFGYWQETLAKWAQQGYITPEMAQNWADGGRVSRDRDHQQLTEHTCREMDESGIDNTNIDKQLCEILGFDFDWYNCFRPDNSLRPTFENKVLKQRPDGSREVLNQEGVVVLEKDDAHGIPSEISHTLVDRNSWEQHYKPRLRFVPERVKQSLVNTEDNYKPYLNGGLDYLKQQNRENPIGLLLGSLLGNIRNWIGLEGLSYLYMDDEELFDEIIDTNAELCYQCAQTVLQDGAKFDFAHYWEDICFKNGPLVIPSVFEQKVGPHYRRLTELVSSHGINIISLDCDGLIDSLVPIWFKNGVNTMFPIEVGTWKASIATWRQEFGQQLRGVGGMDKKVFAYDYAAIDAEIERLKPLVELGGYIPCPDHRIAPDAKWENVKYYCDKMRDIFS